MIDTTLDLSDVMTLIETVDQWENHVYPSSSKEFKTKMLEKANELRNLIGSDEEKFEEEMRKTEAEARKMLQNEEETRKERAIFLKAKLYDLRNSLRLKESLKGTQVVTNEPEDKK